MLTSAPAGWRARRAGVRHAQVANRLRSGFERVCGAGAAASRRKGSKRKRSKGCGAASATAGAAP